MICYIPMLSNISFWLILDYPMPSPPPPPRGLVLFKWANGGLTLVFMILGHFSLISSRENGSNGMLHDFITKNVNFINSGHLGDGPLVGEHRKKDCPTLMMWQKTVFHSAIGVLCINNKKFHMDSMSRSVGVAAGLWRLTKWEIHY